MLSASSAWEERDGHGLPREEAAPLQDKVEATRSRSSPRTSLVLLEPLIILCVSASRAGCRNRETVILCQGLEGMLPADVAPTGAFGVADRKRVRTWCLPGLLSLSAATIAANSARPYFFQQMPLDAQQMFYHSSISSQRCPDRPP